MSPEDNSIHDGLYCSYFFHFSKVSTKIVWLFWPGVSLSSLCIVSHHLQNFFTESKMRFLQLFSLTQILLCSIYIRLQCVRSVYLYTYPQVVQTWEGSDSTCGSLCHNHHRTTAGPRIEENTHINRCDYMEIDLYLYKSRSVGVICCTMPTCSILHSLHSLYSLLVSWLSALPCV